MGRLNDLLKRMARRAAGEPPDPRDLRDAVARVVGGELGGPRGLEDAFARQGLGGLLAAWRRGKSDRRLTPPELVRVLGAPRLRRLANGLGLTVEDTAVLLVEALPTLLRELHPEEPDA